MLGLDLANAGDQNSVDHKPPITFQSQQAKITPEDQALVTTINTTISAGPSRFRQKPHECSNDQLVPLIPEGTTKHEGKFDGDTRDLITLIDFDFFESDNASKLISSSSVF